MLVVAACMTSFYSWRLMFLTFFGASRGAIHGHAHTMTMPHESPMVMLVPLGVLALGAVFSGMIWYKELLRPLVGLRSAPGSHGSAAVHGDAEGDGRCRRRKPLRPAAEAPTGRRARSSWRPTTTCCTTRTRCRNG
jgi:NADH-quinone oxidoreductase subunit L